MGATDSGPFGVPAIPPSNPAPKGYHYKFQLMGNGLGGYRGLWNLERDDPSAAVPQSSGGGGGTTSAPAPLPPYLQFSFDTIGQVIFRSIGDCRLPMQLIWVLGIGASGEATTSTTITGAWALCQPIDPLEEGFIFRLYDGANQIYSTDDGITPPSSWSTTEQAQLIASMAGLTLYPGTQSQLPANVIVADKGASVTPAYRSLRYVIIPNYPISKGLPRFSVAWRRTNPNPPTGGGSSGNIIAVEFEAGAG